MRVAFPGFRFTGFSSAGFRERVRLESDLAFGVAVVCGRRVFWDFMATAGGVEGSGGWTFQPPTLRCLQISWKLDEMSTGVSDLSKNSPFRVAGWLNLEVK
jgi:hypothetical protein